MTRRGFVEDMWGESALSGYESMVTYPQDRGIAFDTCISHLATLQGYRPRPIVIHANPISISEDLRAHLRQYGDGLLMV